MGSSAKSKRIYWQGIGIVEDITDGNANPGVDTLEGRIGPLLKGEGSSAHFIEMPGGLFCEEHPHSTESLIFTVKGQGVLCSQVCRQLMKPGALFWFKAGTPTGYEVPLIPAVSARPKAAIGEGSHRGNPFPDERAAPRSPCQSVCPEPGAGGAMMLEER